VLTPAPELLLRLPKSELHVHLDGSLRPGTLLALAHERDVELPARSAADLADHMLVSDASSLEEYLQRFEVTLAVMQDADALERIAYELAEDHAAENVLYVEVRFCPALNTAKGLASSEAVEATLRGLARAKQDLGIQSGVIVCALRSHAPSRSLEMADLAVGYAPHGVCGFDLAGAEAGNPVADHIASFERASRAGVPITIHAGEGYGAESIRQAVEVGHARRIGHGTRLHEDRALMELIAARGIPLETCLTSNVQTRVVTSHGDHPARLYLDEGLTVCLGTDNRLMSGVTLTQEYEHARDELDLTWKELVAVARAGFEHAFVDPATRVELLRRFDQDVAAIES